MSGLERLGGASQDLSAAASLLGHSDKKSADDLVSHPRFLFFCINKSFRGGLLPAFSIRGGRAVARL